MPKVMISYRPHVASLDGAANRLADQIPKIVADALTCANPQGHLVPEDVEVEVKAISSGFRTKYSLLVEVEANDYPERRKTLEQRTHQILCAIRIFLNGEDWHRFGFKGWVWVKLFTAYWGEV